MWLQWKSNDITSCKCFCYDTHQDWRNFENICLKVREEEVREQMRRRRRNAHLLFEEVPLLKGECVCLGNDRNYVDHFTKAPHELHIQRSQTEEGRQRQSKLAEYLTCYDM